MSNRPLFKLASVFAFGEFALLLYACISQFEPNFRSEEAMAAIGLALLCAIIATIVSVTAYFASQREWSWPWKLSAAVWLGFVVLMVLGLVINVFTASIHDH